MLDEALEAPTTRAYRARKSAARIRASGSNRMPIGVKMKLFGWAIALAAAGLTPAAAQTTTSAPAPAQTSAAAPAVATPPAGTAQNAGKADVGQPAVVPGT